MRCAAAAAILAMLLLVGASQAAGSPPEINVWAGQWVTSPPAGGFAFRVLSVRAGFRAFDELHAERCYPPTTYYRGAYYDPKTGVGGKIIGCTEGAWHVVGRYLGDPVEDPGAAGAIDIQFKPPNTFDGTFTPDSTKKPVPYHGVRGKHFAEDAAFSPLVVNFEVRVSGKPNIKIRPVGFPLVSATLRTTEPSHATFTKYNAKVPDILEATETKGKIVLDVVKSVGAKYHYEFGIISGTGYSTQARRLGVLLRTQVSNDPRCPVGTSGALLYLLPTFQGVRDTAILFGIPYSKTIEIEALFGFLKEKTQPCTSLAYGWENGDVGVHVSTRLAETVPGGEK